MSHQPIKEITLPKKAFTSIDLKAWISGNYDRVVNSYIDNVYLYPEGKIFTLKLRSREAPVATLIMQPSARIHFTTFKIEYGDAHPPELTRVRQLVRDKRIKDISQIGFDRLLNISLYDGFSIILELLPRGELIITDERGTVLYASEYKQMKDRKIAYGQPYQYPPLITSMPSEEECSSNPEALRVFPREVLLEAKARGGDLCRNIRDIIKEATELKRGYLAYRDDKPVYYSPFRPTFMEVAGFAVEEGGSFNDVVDKYFYTITSEIISQSETMKLREAIEKLTKTIEKERGRANEYLEKANEYKRWADYMLFNREALEEILSCAREAIDKRGWDALSLECPSIASASPSEGKISVKVGPTEITLDVRFSLKELIAKYYDEYKRYKQKYEKALEAISELERNVQEQIEAMERRKSEAVTSIRKASWYERYVWSFTRNKLLIIAGRDAQQNESIVRRYMSDGDYFFHADVQGAAATILKIPVGTAPTDGDVSDAAVVAACYSRAWKAGLASIDVFYVKGEQVSKAPPSGEYLPTGSFMIYGKKNFVKNVMLELAFGIEYTSEGYMRFTVGSRESVVSRGDLLGYLYPGENPPSKIAERIRKRIRERGYTYVPSQSEIERLLPGPSKIKFTD